jgi:hypothetical protein
LEEGEVLYKKRSLASTNYEFKNGELEFCDKQFVESKVSEMKNR